jgi:hypothetical protein
MDAGNVNHECEEVVESDPVTAAAAASISLNPPPTSSKPLKQQHQQHIITTYAKPVSTQFTTLNAVPSSAGFTVVPSSSHTSTSKTIVVLPVTSSSNPASGDAASQPVLKKLKLG